MNKFVYVGDDEMYIYYTLKIEGWTFLFKYNMLCQTMSFDMDSVAWALGYEDAIDMMSNDFVLDLLNELKKLFGKWLFADLLIEKNNLKLLI